MSHSDTNIFAVDNQTKSSSICDELADCAFIIDGKEIRAHKLKLTYSSPVFEKMFFGELASNRITITDINLEDFCQMLEFIYTDNVNIKSVLHAWSLFYIAHKYLLSDFAKVCVTYIQENISINNLVLNYEYAEVYELKDLQKVCLNIIKDYIRGIFHDRCGYHMKPSSILSILEQPVLNINNNDLIKCVLHWAVTECDMQNITLSAQNIILLLSSLKILEYLINLDFNVDNNSSELIVECSKLIKNLRNPNVPFKNYLKKHWCKFCKCRLIYKIAGRIALRRGDVLTSYISVNHDTYLFGLVVVTEDKQFGITNNEYDGSIKIEISQINDHTSTVITTISKTLTYETLVYVPLSELVFLERDQVYSVKIGYTNFDRNVRHSSVLCNYMCNKLCDNNRETIFSFDEMDGSVIKGVCYYPA